MDLELKQFIKSGIIKELGTTPFTVWMVILSFTDIQGTAFPSQETIADLIGVSTKTVQRAVKKLEDSGLIEKELVRKGMKLTTVYTQPDIDPTEEQEEDIEILAEESETVETQEQEQQVRKYNNSKDFIQRFCELYFETYNVHFNPSWGRDGSMVKHKLLPIYTDEELDAILEITFRDYQKRWANRQYPRPTLGAVCTFIANQSLAIWQGEQKNINKITEAEETDLDIYFRNQGF